MEWLKLFKKKELVTWVPINELQELGRQDLDSLIRDVATCIRIADGR